MIIFILCPFLNAARAPMIQHETSPKIKDKINNFSSYSKTVFYLDEINTFSFFLSQEYELEVVMK